MKKEETVFRYQTIRVYKDNKDLCCIDTR